MPILQRTNTLFRSVIGTSILPLGDRIKALMKLKPPINIKEIRHFIGLVGYYCEFIYSYAEHSTSTQLFDS